MNRWFFSGILGTVCALALSAAAQAAELESWQFNVNQNRLTFYTDESVQPTAQLLNNPTRLVIDLPGTRLGETRRNQVIGGGIREVRVSQFDRQTTRIVVELEPGYTIDPQQVQVQGITTSEWTVALPAVQPVASAPLPPLLSPPSRSPGGGVALTVPAPSGEAPPPRSVLPLPPADTRPDLTLPSVNNERILVAIDPGHGGRDPGAVGIGGLRETDIVLPISLRVAELLEAQGVQTILTREDDREIDLEPRVSQANRANADLFVSIHANAISMSRPDINGAETYYYSSAEGRSLAQSIQDSVAEMTGMRDIGVKQARFYVLRRTAMPAALVEVGFVTGRDDAARLADPDFRDLMAQAIARGILLYIQNNP